jgi:hypothetical protein
MGKPIYTEVIHAKRLIRMFERQGKRKRLGCPAQPYYGLGSDPDGWWGGQSPCFVCIDLLGISFDQVERKGAGCPCDFFESCEEAAKVTWLALEEKGYLDEEG